jgi:hypothetical protein
MAKATVSHLVVGDFDYELSPKRLPVAGPVSAPAAWATWGIASESGLTSLAMIAAVNILRIAIGLVTTTSGQNAVRQDSGFYPDKSYARASGQTNGNDSTARERQAPKCGFRSS